MNKTAIAAALLLATGVANAAPVSTGGTFDMYDPTNALSGTDASISGFVDQEAGTWRLSSSTPFYGQRWNVHDGVLYNQGTYTIDTIEGAPISFTVGAGQIGGHILFNWGATANIDVVIVWDINADGSLSYAAVPGMTDGPFPGFHASFNLTSPALASHVPVAYSYHP